MKQTELDTPLSPRELDELREVLLSIPGAMSLPRADGFLTGIASAPTTFMPSAWYSEIIGDHTHESFEEAARIHGLVVRLFNQIVGGLNDGRNIRPPRSLDQEDSSEWCRGYLTASRMDEVWMGDELGVSRLRPFAVVAGELDLVGQDAADGKVIEDPTAQLEESRRKLPELVLAQHQYWTAWRRNQMRASAPATSLRVGPKVGRNDACPCGSGLKYKRCCARAG